MMLNSGRAAAAVAALGGYVDIVLSGKWTTDRLWK